MTTAVRAFREGDEAGVRAVMEASLSTDRIPGFVRSDIERALVRVIPDPEGTVVALEGARVVGYCTPNHDDLTVLPEARRRGHGRRLVGAAREVVRRRGQRELQLYVPSHLAGSVAFAQRLGFTYRSSLWMFVLDAGHAVPAPQFPGDVVVRTWDVARDTDLEAWTAFMHRAFEGHPTRMSWAPAVIAHIHTLPGFDPGGILIVAARDRPDDPIAFARIEVNDPDSPVGQRTGDVGLIGVLPAWRRRGLGRELLRWGVTQLRSRGAGPIELSVEAANERATALYRGHGFEPSVEWPHWVVPA